MKISTKSRYGLRIMHYLAHHHNNEPVKLKDMAQKENLSEKYLEQIIISLKAANLVKSVRGAKGGYFLSKEPDKQSVLEIIEKLEGPLHFVNCVEDHTLCERSKDCVTRKLWDKVGSQMRETLAHINLSTLDSCFLSENP